MRGLLLLLCLLTALGVVPGAGAGAVPGSPRNISLDDAGLGRAVLDATYAFNNRSNDAFLFRTASIQKAQRQMVKGIRYIADVLISRTVCLKRDGSDPSHCHFQPEGLLHQTFRCHFEVWSIPWLQVMKTTFFICRP